MVHVRFRPHALLGALLLFDPWHMSLGFSEDAEDEEPWVWQGAELGDGVRGAGLRLETRLELTSSFDASVLTTLALDLD